jgi:hypothetical protein
LRDARRGATMDDVPRSAAVQFERRRTAGERRSARRTPFIAAVRSAPAGGLASELALAVDLSESGMRLRRCAGPQQAVLVRLEFELPDGQGPIVAAGRLLFEHGEQERGYRASGVRFIGLDDDEQARIARFVAGH